MKNKDIVWHIYGERGTYNDEEFITLIKQNKVAADALISNRDLGVWLPLKETIYAYYLKQEER